MEISAIEKDGVGTIHFSGQFWKLQDLDLFKKKVNQLIGEECRIVLIDMTRLSYISSQGLGVIVQAFRQMKEKKGRFLLYNPQGNVKEMMEISGLHKIIKILDVYKQLEEFGIKS